MTAIDNSRQPSQNLRKSPPRLAGLCKLWVFTSEDLKT